MNQEDWSKFAKTGRIEDYLFYRANMSCQNKTEKYGDENSESVDDYDRDDSVGSADRRV